VGPICLEGGFRRRQEKGYTAVYVVPVRTDKSRTLAAACAVPGVQPGSFVDTAVTVAAQHNISYICCTPRPSLSPAAQEPSQSGRAAHL
jgi:hypothetical protein